LFFFGEILAFSFLGQQNRNEEMPDAASSRQRLGIQGGDQTRDYIEACAPYAANLLETRVHKQSTPLLAARNPAAKTFKAIMPLSTIDGAKTNSTSLGKGAIFRHPCKETTESRYLPI